MIDKYFSRRTISLGFDIQTTLLLKVVCCFVIALHHFSLYQIYTLRTINGNNLFSKLGYIAVGLFFFLSAYGNSVTFKKEIGVFSSLLKKFKSILVPYCLAHLTFFILFWLFVPDYDCKKHIVDTVVFNGPFWFLKVLFLFIVITEIANRYITQKKWQVLFLLFALSIYYYFNLSTEGYLRLSTYAYLCGFLFARYKTISFPIFIIGTISLVLTTIVGYIYYKEIGQVCLCCFTSCFFTLTVNHFPLRKSIPKGTNNFSYFVYLSHMYFVPYFLKYGFISITIFLSVVSIASIVLLFMYTYLKKVELKICTLC